MSTEVPASLKEQLAKRREELGKEHTFDLPVPGYSDYGLVARYKVLDYPTERRIAKRHEKIPNEVERELCMAGDCLTASCIDLLLDQDGKLESLGQRFNREGASEIFGIDLPEEAPARDAIFSILGNDTALLMTHLVDWRTASLEAMETIQEGVEAVLVGPTMDSSD